MRASSVVNWQSTPFCWALRSRPHAWTSFRKRALSPIRRSHAVPGELGLVRRGGIAARPGLIVLEVDGLEEDVNTVRESPDGHADLRERMLLDHGGRGRHRRDQRRICRRVYIGLNRCFYNPVEDQLELFPGWNRNVRPRQ